MEIEIDIEVSDFDEKNKRWLQYALASFLEIKPDNVRIRAIREGSTRVILQIPESKKKHLAEAITSGNRKLARHLGPLSIRSVRTGVIANEMYALLVGIDRYLDPRLSALLTPSVNAERVSQVLLHSYGVGAQNVRLVTNELATRSRILRALLRLIEEAGPNDSIILYFSGHSYIDELRDGDSYLCSYDTTPGHWRETALSDKELARFLSSSSAGRRSFVALDLPSFKKDVFRELGGAARLAVVGSGPSISRHLLRWLARGNMYSPESGDIDIQEFKLYFEGKVMQSGEAQGLLTYGGLP